MNAGLGRFCNTATAVGCIGRDALLRVAKEGPVQQIRAIAIDAKELPGCDRPWPLMAGDKRVGRYLMKVPHQSRFPIIKKLH